MKSKIDEAFFEKNLFEKAKIGAGYHPWVYYDKCYTVSIATRTDGGEIHITVYNNETKQSIEFSKSQSMGAFFTKEELRRCIQFIGVPDEFDYE